MNKQITYSDTLCNQQWHQLRMVHCIGKRYWVSWNYAKDVSARPSHLNYLYSAILDNLLWWVFFEEMWVPWDDTMWRICDLIVQGEAIFAVEDISSSSDGTTSHPSLWSTATSRVNDILSKTTHLMAKCLSSIQNLIPKFNNFKQLNKNGGNTLHVYLVKL